MISGTNGRKIWLTFTLLAALTLGAFAALQATGTVISLSHSLPPGLYRSATGGNLVAFCPPRPWGTLSAARGYRATGGLYCPDNAMPLLKPVVAAYGDRVSFSAAGVAINGVLLPNSAPLDRDVAGRPLAHWPFGDYMVSGIQLWVVSTYNPHSFDSRYFGPIDTASVLRRMEPLIIF